jgi:glycosyltransferase involved in cell wall biosynthesis
MHVLVIPSWYPSEDNLIRGCFFREQALALVKNGQKVGVIYPELRSLKLLSKSFVGWKYGLEVQDDLGIATYRWHGWGITSQIPYLYESSFLAKGLKLFQTYIEENGIPDIIHAHSAFAAGMLSAKIKEVYKIPYVLTEHSSAFASNSIQAWQKQEISHAFKQANQLITVSPSLGKTLEIHYPESVFRYSSIPNIVSDYFFRQSYNGGVNQKEVFNFLNISKMSPKKGQHDLIRSFKKVFDNQPNVRLKIVGDGPLRQELEELTDVLGITSQVDFLGELTRNQIYQALQSADVLVHPSHYETFGVVLIEALACGLPIVATACGGPEYIVTPKNGVLVEPKNIEELSNAMLFIYKNIAKFDSIEISKDCASQFSEKSVIDQIILTYKNILPSANYL